MPIVQTQQRANPTAGLPLLGFINKGGERTEDMIAKKRPGADLDYFRVTLAERFGHLEGAVRRIYGEKPTFFDPVLVFGTSPETAFDYWREERGLGGKRVERRCDGQQQVMWYDEQGARHDAAWDGKTVACRGGGEHGGCATCQFAGRMNIFLVQLFRETGVYGYFHLHTGSQIDIASLSGTLARWSGFPNLEIIPFKLGREPRHVGWRTYTDKKDNKEKTAEVVKSLLYLDLSESAAAKIGAYINEQTGLLPELAGVGSAPQLPVGTLPITDGEIIDEDEHWALDKTNRQKVFDAFTHYQITKDQFVEAMGMVEPGLTKLGDSQYATVDEFLDAAAKVFGSNAPSELPEDVPF